MTDTIRTAADFQALFADAAAAHSSNRQLIRDLALSAQAWGAPVVADNTARATLFPSPAGDERVFNRTSGAVERYDVASAAWVLDVRGAPPIVKADGRFATDGVMNGTTAVLTSASNLFRAIDVGKLILVPGAGAAGALLTTTIASYQSAGQVTLAVASQTAVAAARLTWGTDDTAAWAAIYANTPEGGPVIVPWGYSLIQGGPWMGGITKSLDIQGLGVSEIWGTVSQSSLTSVPGVAPYIRGSVIVQCTAAMDGLLETGTGITVNKRNFGIKFADGIAFLNTGHGFKGAATATTDGTHHENGPVGEREDNLIVWGHDGNHYGYWKLNANLGTHAAMRSYGGGVLYCECDSAVSAYGNCVFAHPYGAMFAGGTAHGFALNSRTSAFPGLLNLIEFWRPQAIGVAVPPTLTGQGIPAVTSAQKLFNSKVGAGTPAEINIIDPDMETNFSQPVDFTGCTVQNNGLTPSGIANATQARFPGGIIVGPGTTADGFVQAIVGGDLYMETQTVGKFVRVGTVNAGGVILAKAAGQVGFFGSGGSTKPAISGSRGGNAALADLLTKLAAMNLLTDSTTA